MLGFSWSHARATLKSVYTVSNCIFESTHEYIDTQMCIVIQFKYNFYWLGTYIYT